MLNEKQSDKWPETSHDINLIALLPFNRSLEHIELGSANHWESAMAGTCKKPSQGGNIFLSDPRFRDVSGREQFQVQPEGHKADS